MIEKEMYAICSQALANIPLEADCKEIAKAVQYGDYNAVAKILKITIATSVTVCIQAALENQNKK